MYLHFRSSSTTCEPKSLTMDVAAVVCGERQEEAMNMVKSVLIFTTDQPIHFHIVAEHDLQEGIKKTFEGFPPNARENMEFTLYNISYPPGEDIRKWKNLFKPCASQRLFLPVILLLDLRAHHFFCGFLHQLSTRTGFKGKQQYIFLLAY